MALLEGKDISKIYGGKKGVTSTPALNGINIRLEDGEFVGVMGPSGSGKSTLLNILSGIDKATGGSVIIGGKNITDMTGEELALFRRRKMGFVFQEYNLLDSLTLKENVLLPMILDHVAHDEMEKRAVSALEFFGIGDIAGKYPYNVSGGQQQRAAVARAVINQPDVVFADEPTGNLDSKSSRAVMKIFEQMNAEKKVTVLMVTHDPFAASHCSRIIFIKDGRVNMEIVRTGERKEFFDRILDCLAVLGGESSEF